MVVKKNTSLEDRVRGLQQSMRLTVIILSALVIANIGFFAFIQYSYINKETSDKSAEPKAKQLSQEPVVKKNYQMIITSFFNNTAISEVGYQLELKRQSISSKNTTNCFTPSPPPLKNGCGFVVRPYASGIPNQGTYLLNMILQANIGNNDKIVVDIRDSERDQNISSLDDIEGKSKELFIPLPPTLNQNEQLLLRLWPQQGSEITITEIVLEYLELAKLQPVKLNFPQNLIPEYANKKVKIYMDKDKNGLFDDSIDVLWNCVVDFAGVKQSTIDSTGKVELTRDDSCVKKGAPTSWKTDKGLQALAPYQWLAVVEIDNSTSDIYPFEVVNGISEYDLT